MPVVKLLDLEHTNVGLSRGRVGSRDHSSAVLVINRTSASGTYMDTLHRVLSTITKICDAQIMTSKRQLKLEADLATVQNGRSHKRSILEYPPVMVEDRSRTKSEGFVSVRILPVTSWQPYLKGAGRQEFGFDMNQVLVKIVTPIIKSALVEGTTYKQFKKWSSSIIDQVVGSMPGATHAEHLGPNAVWTIARLSMNQIVYLRLEDIRYLSKIGSLGEEQKASSSGGNSSII